MRAQAIKNQFDCRTAAPVPKVDDFYLPFHDDKFTSSSFPRTKPVLTIRDAEIKQ